jgi:hypothetical protein
VDAQLPYPAIMIFPSWEKLLEEKDPHTQEGINRLISDVTARFIDPKLENISDVFELARNNPDHFIEAMEKNHLIVAPGGAIGQTARDALQLYEEHVERWRAPEYKTKFKHFLHSEKLLILFIERMTPHYHLVENAEELHAQPLLSIGQQAHYFNLVSQTNIFRLEKLGLVDSKESSIVKSFSSGRLNWLSQLPMDALVEIRKNNENSEFRKRLDGAVSKLHESALQDIGVVTAEICSEIDHAIADHNREMGEINSKYNQKHIKIAGAAALASTAALVPSLAPYLGAALPLAVATKFAWDVWDRRTEKRKKSKSLMGFLASSRNSG